MPDPPPLGTQVSKFSIAHTILEQGEKIQSNQNEAESESKSEATRPRIEQKDFFWDHLLFYIGSAILALTALDISVEFLRGSRGVICFTENSDFTRDQVAFINSYCAQSLPLAEYFPIFIIVQGILLLAPHYLWQSLFRSYFDSFFGLVNDLDRLRDPKTGEYADKNINIVNKLEAEFSSYARGIFLYYILKLFFQLLVAFSSVLVSETVFLNFSTSFPCPHAEIPPDWPLNNLTFTCVFSSLRILSVIRYSDYILIAIGVLANMFGLLWCLRRHTTELGYQDIAKFAFTSGLSPESFVSPNPLLSSHHSCKERFRAFFSPRIRNDLDFLLMWLFRADAGIGQAFKDVQIYKELKRHHDQDHELLHVFIDAQQDEEHRQWKIPKNEKNQNNKIDVRRDIGDYFWGAGYSHRTDFRPFYDKISANPEHKEDFRHHFSHRMGNVNWADVHHPSIRDRFYAFVGLSEMNRKALDIAFGSSGYVLELSRAFRKVIAVNFHPFYRNEKEVCRKQKYNTNFCAITVVGDLFTKNSKDVVKFDEQIDPEMLGPDGTIDYKEEKEQINFIVVGPITDPAKKITVNVVLEQLHSPHPPYIADNAILLAIRPLKIEHEDVSKLYQKYEPPKGLFDHSYHAKYVQPQLKNLRGRVKLLRVGGYEGIPVKCGSTNCVFEFSTYRYCRGTSKPSEESTATAIHHTGIRNEPELKTTDC